MKPFPFAIWPNTLKKGQTKTTSFEEESRKPHIAEVLASETPQGNAADFFHDGKGYSFTQTGKDRESGRNIFSHSTGSPPAIIPSNLRKFLRDNGYSEDYIDKIIDDNYTAHKSAQLKDEEAGLDSAQTRRPPVYFFAPGVHESMMRLLNKTGEVFGSGDSKTPLEQLGFLLGTHHLDTETGTPYIVAHHFVAQDPYYNSSMASDNMGGDLFDKTEEFLDKYPHAFIVGHAHSHPPGNMPIPSEQDMISSLRTGFPEETLRIIHSPSTIRDDAGNFLSGQDAAHYLATHARFTEGTRNKQQSESKPWLEHPRQWSPVYSEFEAQRIFGNGESATGYYIGPNTNPFPATHSFHAGRRISTPNQIQIMGARGGPAIAPGRIGTPENRPVNFGVNMTGDSIYPPQGVRGNVPPVLETGFHPKHTADFSPIDHNGVWWTDESFVDGPKQQSSILKTDTNKSFFSFAIWPLQKAQLDFSNSFNTQLSPAQEQLFLRMAEKFPQLQGSHDYDMRGWWLSQLNSGAKGKAFDVIQSALPKNGGHYTDQFKKPNHPTFSTGSQYHGVAGHVGGQWSQAEDGSWDFHPSRTNLEMHGPAGLQEYWNRVEPTNRIHLPPSTTSSAPPLSTLRGTMPGAKK